MRIHLEHYAAEEFLDSCCPFNRVFPFSFFQLWTCHYKKPKDRCHQWSTRPDPQSRQEWTFLFLLEICFVLLDFEKCGRTYGRTTCAKTIITTPAVTVGRPSESKENIWKNQKSPLLCFLAFFWLFQIFSIPKRVNKMIAFCKLFPWQFFVKSEGSHWSGKRTWKTDIGQYGSTGFFYPSHINSSSVSK